MARPTININFIDDRSTSNDAAVSSKASLGSNTNSFTQSTSGKQPVFKTSNAKLQPALGSCLFDGSDVINLASAQSLTATDPHTIIIAWVDGDYTSDTWLIASDTNDAHYGIDAGGNGILLKPNSARSPSGDEVTIPTNNTDNSTVSYSFGSDVEVLTIVNVGDDNVRFYNIDGDLIATASNALFDSTFLLKSIAGKPDGSFGLNGSLLAVYVFEDRSIAENKAKRYGALFKQFKD